MKAALVIISQAFDVSAFIQACQSSSNETSAAACQWVALRTHQKIMGTGQGQTPATRIDETVARASCKVQNFDTGKQREIASGC